MITQKEKIIKNTAAEKQDEDVSEDEDEDTIRKRVEKPSDEAVAKFQDYSERDIQLSYGKADTLIIDIPYVDDEQEQAACKNQQLQLVFRLIKAKIEDESEFSALMVIPTLQAVDRCRGACLAHPRICSPFGSQLESKDHRGVYQESDRPERKESQRTARRH